MKRICIIVFVALATIMQVQAQVSNDTTVLVQDTTTKVETEEKYPKLTVKPSKTKNKNRKNGKETNDCDQCFNQLAQANKDNKSLEKIVGDLNKKLGTAKALLDIDDRDFYRSLITTPLKRKYDSIQVDYYKKTVALFDHENKKEMKWVYEVYYPLLENYGKFNKDLARLIHGVIRVFELDGKPDSKLEKELFNEGLEEMDYYKLYRYMGVSSKKKDNPVRIIEYLEDVINDTKTLFDNPSKFTKENFEEQLRRL